MDNPTVAVAATTNNKPALGPQTRVFALGRKRFALAHEEFKGQPQTRLLEVTPRVDVASMTCIGWDRVFDGLQLTAKPDELRDFLSDVRGALTKPTTE